jgi:hypothetical protein
MVFSHDLRRDELSFAFVTVAVDIYVCADNVRKVKMRARGGITQSHGDENILQQVKISFIGQQDNSSTTGIYDMTTNILRLNG